MTVLEEDIVAAAAGLGVSVRTLDIQDVHELLQGLQSKYGTRDGTGRRLWENLGNLTGVRDPMGWTYVDHICGAEPVIMLIEDGNDSGYEIESGLATKEILSDLIGFEFYLTDRDLTYIVAFNDHDVLIVGGAATLRAQRYTSATKDGFESD